MSYNEHELTNKQIREQREFETLFKNPKHARAMWSKEIIDRYAKPAIPPIVVVDSKGNVTEESQIQNAIWDNLLAELKSRGLDRLPTEGEMMDACQAYYARTNASAYVARRDSMGAKPIDETKQSVTTNNPLEGLSDEQLEVMKRALDEYEAKQNDESSKRESEE